MAARVKIGLTGAFPGPGEPLGPLEGARRADLHPAKEMGMVHVNFAKMIRDQISGCFI